MVGDMSGAPTGPGGEGPTPSDAMEGRRPLASRRSRAAIALGRWLAGTSLTPNQISLAGMAAALVGALCLALAGGAAGGPRTALLLAAAVLIQLRLVCNLLDGMVAVEGGKASRDGAFWNEVPDRVSDVALLVGAGYGAGHLTLGWAAACFAVMTAYIRFVGTSLGLKADYRGPMAKPQRMALLTAAAVAACFVTPAPGSCDVVLAAALWAVALGAGLTALLRACRILQALRAGG
jgi:phosphatidylglycerophosphate synthase